jgi:hypothetical protein
MSGLTFEGVVGQRRFPVVIRIRNQPLLCMTPYMKDNQAFLQLTTRRPRWNPEHKLWELPRAWFNEIVTNCAQRWGTVYVIQPYNELEKCARACWDAVGLECNCSCMGKNHGMRQPSGRWYEISESCAISWMGESLRISVIHAKNNLGGAPPR